MKMLFLLVHLNLLNDVMIFNAVSNNAKREWGGKTLSQKTNLK